MSRTYKSNPGYCRIPRGHKQALMRGEKKNAVPTDTWYEPEFSDSCLRNLIYKLSEKGWDDELIIKHLTKFHGYKEWAVRLSCKWWTKNNFDLPYPYYDNGKDKVRNKK